MVVCTTLQSKEVATVTQTDRPDLKMVGADMDELDMPSPSGIDLRSNFDQSEPRSLLIERSGVQVPANSSGRVPRHLADKIVARPIH
eukprot:5254544-Pyramimonas_sp.AAC.1